MGKNEKRENWVDYTKVFACFLVLLGHLLQGLNKAGIVWKSEWYKNIDTFIYIFHMPLFMCLSGYLYGKFKKIENKKEYFNFIKRKLLNLGIPYIVFYLAYVVINMIFAGEVNSQKGIQDILNIFTNPISPFWFLYALIVIFIFIPIIEKIFKNNTKFVFLFLMILHILKMFFNTKIYAVDIFAQFAVYFYFGVILKNICQRERKTIQIIINDIAFCILGIIYCIIIGNIYINTYIMQVTKLILALYGTVVIIETFINAKSLDSLKWLKNVSKYTFPIYLMHTTFSAGARIILLKVNIHNFYLHLIIGIIAGIFGPIIIAKMLEKSVYGNLLIYPINIFRKIRRNNDECCNDRT